MYPVFQLACHYVDHGLLHHEDAKSSNIIFAFVLISPQELGKVSTRVMRWNLVLGRAALLTGPLYSTLRIGTPDPTSRILFKRGGSTVERV